MSGFSGVVIVYFQKDETPWGFKPHRYECPICGGKRILHFSSMAQPYDAEGWVCHLEFKCLECCSVQTHSVPISESYKEELVKRRDGERTYVPWSWEYQRDKGFVKRHFKEGEKKKVKKRLKKLGYF